ncbi:MAG: hypothetical protein GVY36_17460 [Verrucomicrobia bacterium]|jgi:energy-coupling factor transporter ATP-binding protein EcfA2|nr:hypothetical protein [Verrucomicrobiota bacterium]
MTFADIDFGYASAEQEGARNPTLLLEGFLDHDRIIPEARSGHKFLFLGNKGSGKSAIAEHLRLLQSQESHLFVQTIYLSDFPYTDFKRIIRGDAEPESKYPTAWSWLLLITLFNSFNKDQGAHSKKERAYHSALEALEKMDLLTDQDLAQVARATSKRSFTVKTPVNFELEYQSSVDEEGVRIPFFVDRLREIAANFKSDSDHLLVIDGLDDILTGRKVQYDSLAALILEVSRLNTIFQRNGAPVKIILLCRTDLFERLPGTNKNKIRQDSAFHLDWYKNINKPWESDLIQLANLRAGLSNDEIDNVFSEFLPYELNDTLTQVFLIDMTRHNPRDFLQLLIHMQKFSGEGRLSEAEALNGIGDYSRKYFLPEMKDELVGYFDTEEVARVFNLITHLGKNEFTLEELNVKSQSYDHFARLDLDSIVHALFECGAIGNVDVRPNGRFYKWKFRNKNASLDKLGRLVVHKGLYKALNLV